MLSSYEASSSEAPPPLAASGSHDLVTRLSPEGEETSPEGLAATAPTRCAPPAETSLPFFCVRRSSGDGQNTDEAAPLLVSADDHKQADSDAEASVALIDETLRKDSEPSSPESPENKPVVIDGVSYRGSDYV